MSADYPHRPMFAVDWDDTCVEEYREDGTPYWPEMGPWLPPDAVTGVTPQEALKLLASVGRTVIYTLRCHLYEWDDVTPRFRGDVQEQWLMIRHRLDEAGLTDVRVYPPDRGKPPAQFYIDDRGIEFKRNWGAILERVMR